MSKERKLSLSGISVLFFMKGKGEPVSGAEITRELDIGSGTLYPLLANLTQKGFLKAAWENGSAAELGRPLNHFYELTPVGAARTDKELQKMRQLIARIDS